VRAAARAAAGCQRIAPALTCPLSPARSFCRKLVASTVMSYLAWLCLVPSVYINVADNEDGPW
jgi:hypothetical protein